MPKITDLSMKHSARQIGVMFILFLLLHLFIAYFANQSYPDRIVIGNHFFTFWYALLYSMSAITAIVVISTPFIEWVVEHLKLKLIDLHWLLAYFLLNFGAIWTAARGAEMLGMGISSWEVAAALAAVFTVGQSLIVKFLIRPIK